MRTKRKLDSFSFLYLHHHRSFPYERILKGSCEIRKIRIHNFLFLPRLFTQQPTPLSQKKTKTDGYFYLRSLNSYGYFYSRNLNSWPVIPKNNRCCGFLLFYEKMSILTSKALLKHHHTRQKNIHSIINNFRHQGNFFIVFINITIFFISFSIYFSSSDLAMAINAFSYSTGCILYNLI